MSAELEAGINANSNATKRGFVHDRVRLRQKCLSYGVCVEFLLELQALAFFGFSADYLYDHFVRCSRILLQPPWEDQLLRGSGL